MIIPPVALAISAVVVVVKLLISGQIDGSNDEAETSRAERIESQNSQLASNCRFRTESVPHRDLSPLSKTADESSSTQLDQSESPPNTADDPNGINHTKESQGETSPLEAESPEDTDI